MGLLDQFFAQPGLLNDMPPWMQALVQKPGDSQVPPWMQTPLGAPAVPGQFPPMQQDPAALPPNAQQAGPLQTQIMPPQEPRRSIWTPADAPDDSPPVNPNAPQNLQRMAGPALGAPQAPQQQAPGMQAMAQANMPLGQPQMPPQGGNPMGEAGTNIKDFLLGTLTGGPLGGVRAMMGHGKKQETYDQLIASGVDPKKAWFAVNSPDAGKMTGILGSSDTTSDIKEYEYYRKQGGKGTFEDWMTKKKAVTGEYGMNPVYGQDKDGNTVILQLGKSGDMKQSTMPDGVKLSPGVEKIDLGTQWGLYDKRAGVMLGYQPKDVAGAAQQKAQGTAQGAAAVTLPQVESSVNNAFKTIESLKTHPGIDAGTGLSSKIDPRSFIPGQPGYDFHELNKQAQGQAFMAAREALKGAGQVTDFEGKKGEEAIANLNTAQSKDQYLRALDNVKEMIGASYENLKKKATGNFMPSSAAPDADGWTSVNGVRIREKR